MPYTNGMWLFGRKRARSVVLIDITAASVAGAYVRYQDGELPTIYFLLREEIQRKGEETDAQAMLRTLDAVGQELITKGSPVLRRETGSGHVDDVLISIGAPWQDVRVREQSINPGKPFTFTRRILSEILASGPALEEGRVSGGEHVIATMLNGYAVPNPIGKEAKRAVVSVLSSILDKAVADEVRTRVRRLYHAHDIHITAFGAVSYAAMHRAYPHEKDFLILAAAGAGTDVACIKDGRLVNVGSITLGTQGFSALAASPEREQEISHSPLSAPPEYTKPGSVSDARKAWTQALTNLFKAFAESHALPRTLFLVTDPASRDLLRQALDGSILHALWLSDEPLTIIPILPEHLQSYVRNKSASENDLYLSLLAIYQAGAA